MQKTEEMHVCDRVAERKSDKRLTQECGGDEGWAASETGAEDEACEIILIKEFMDTPAERQMKRSGRKSAQREN